MKISSKINELVREFDLSPEEINNGYCADFATALLEFFSETGHIQVFSDDDFGFEYTHTFVKYKGKYYDAECPKGVDNWEELPLFVRNNKG